MWHDAHCLIRAEHTNLYQAYKREVDTCALLTSQYRRLAWARGLYPVDTSNLPTWAHVCPCTWMLAAPCLAHLEDVHGLHWEGLLQAQAVDQMHHPLRAREAPESGVQVMQGCEQQPNITHGQPLAAWSRIDIAAAGLCKHMQSPWPILLMDRALACCSVCPSSLNAFSSKKKLTLLALSRKY